jgi:MFS family permease
MGAIGCLAFVIEASAGSWSAVHIERTLGANPAVSGWGPGIVGLSMIVGRLAWQRRSGRANEFVVLAIGMVGTTVGIVVAATAQTPAVAITGFGIAGLGMAVVGPVVYGFAGRTTDDAQRGRAIAIVTTISYVGLLAGPALIGVLADATSLRTALLWLVPFGLACSALSLVASRTWRDSHST